MGLRFNATGNARQLAIPGSTEHRPRLPDALNRAGAERLPDLERHARADRRRPDGRLRALGGHDAADGLLDPQEVLPFAYSLASTFTLANRWFCSAPCQTYPNRRFLMAGTAYGDIATDNASLSDPPPPNGTIFDRLHAYGISWRNYFTDLPSDRDHPARSSRSIRRTSRRSAVLRRLRRGHPARRSASSIPSSASSPTSAAPLAALPGARGDRRRGCRPPAATRRIRRTCPTARFGRTACCQGRAALAGLAADAVRLHLRRARRLLRPCAAPAGIAPGLDPAEAGLRRRARGLQHLRTAGPGRGRVAVRPSPTPSPTWSTIIRRCWRRSRPSGTCPRSPTATPTPHTVDGLP